MITTLRHMRQHVHHITSIMSRHFTLGSQVSKNVMAGHLYFVATPIGNLSEMSQRAIDVLSEVDVIAAEDTRRTLNLLRHFGIDMRKRRLLSHHEHNKHHSTKGLVSLLKQGMSMAIVSDAGTPGISDPGAELAAACAAENLPLHPVGGPCAISAALSVCGFRGAAYTFYGFLAAKKGKERALQLQQVQDTAHIVVIYEAPHRLVQTLQDLASLSGGRGASRAVVVARELTKVHEEVRHTTVGDALQWAVTAGESKDAEMRLRGEFCLVLGPLASGAAGASDASIPSSSPSSTGTSNADLHSSELEHARSQLQQLQKDGVARSQAVQLVSEISGVRRPVVYKLALQIPW